MEGGTHYSTDSRRPLGGGGGGSHPEQGLLGDGVVLVTRRLHALGHRLSQHTLLLDLPQVLVSLLAGLLQRGREGDQRRLQTPQMGQMVKG